MKAEKRERDFWVKNGFKPISIGSDDQPLKPYLTNRLINDLENPPAADSSAALDELEASVTGLEKANAEQRQTIESLQADRVAVHEEAAQKIADARSDAADKTGNAIKDMGAENARLKQEMGRAEEEEASKSRVIAALQSEISDLRTAPPQIEIKKETDWTVTGIVAALAVLGWLLWFIK